jgi:hypothetical protein
MDEAVVFLGFWFPYLMKAEQMKEKFSVFARLCIKNLFVMAGG